jgi:hypothetical protein
MERRLNVRHEWGDIAFALIVQWRAIHRRLAPIVAASSRLSHSAD